ncbi:hypothetical protein KC878_04405 [Candidatus Saccharibacteria bacterium]|nr:hypothetical protein [Candidatus Saccharibacteria bacterium]MCB9821442.1 hypothetical protein [Candidatus Nomurabacteria bacterium]
MYKAYLAHSDAVHASTSDSIDHWLSSSWNALFVWVLIAVVALVIAPKFIKKLSKANKLFGFALLNFIYGIFLFDKSPGFGAMVLSVGFAITLWTVMLGLSAVETKEVKGAKHNVRRPNQTKRKR